MTQLLELGQIQILPDLTDELAAATKSIASLKAENLNLHQENKALRNVLIFAGAVAGLAVIVWFINNSKSSREDQS